MPFPASPLPDWQVLGTDRRIPVPLQPRPPHSWLGGHSHHRWRVESLSVAPRDASQHTRPDRLRRALPPPPSEASLGPLRPAQARVLRPPPRKSLVPDPGQRTGRTAASTPPPPRVQSGVACSSQMPLSLPAELELNHRGALLEPCAAASSAAARARHAAPEQMTTGLASRDSALRTRPPPPPPPRRPRALLCLRQRTQREPPHSLPTARASQASPPRLRPITTPRVFPPPPRDPHLRIGERRGPT